MSTHNAEDEFFNYFPENYRWSMAMLLALGSSPWGGSEIGEVDRVGKRLRSSVGNDAAWYDEWKRMGEYVEKWGDEALDSGHKVTGGECYLRACNYYQLGERFRQPKDDDSKDTFKKSVNCFQKGAKFIPELKVEKVEIPFEDSSLPAYMIHSADSDGKPKPTVIFYDGLDITKELCYFRGVPELLKRGLACLIVDGPGNGESIRFRGMRLRYDYENVASATVDYLQSRIDIDKQRIGVLGISLGGYFASRSAAFEKRIRACVSWGAVYSYYERWKKRIDSRFTTALSVPADHIKWTLGVDSFDAVLDKLSYFTVEKDSMARNIQCPYLIVHGENDAQSPVADAHKIFELAGSKHKKLKIFTNKEGGTQHCQHDNQMAGISYISDWFADVLLDSTDQQPV